MNRKIEISNVANKVFDKARNITQQIKCSFGCEIYLQRGMDIETKIMTCEKKPFKEKNNRQYLERAKSYVEKIDALLKKVIGIADKFVTQNLKSIRKYFPEDLKQLESIKEKHGITNNTYKRKSSQKKTGDQELILGKVFLQMTSMLKCLEELDRIYELATQNFQECNQTNNPLVAMSKISTVRLSRAAYRNAYRSNRGMNRSDMLRFLGMPTDSSYSRGKLRSMIREFIEK